MTQGSSSFDNNNSGDGRNSRKMTDVKMSLVPLRETIHSGHFMVSDFEPESEVLDDEYEVGMPVPLEDNPVVSSGSGNLPGSSAGTSPQSQAMSFLATRNPHFWDFDSAVASTSASILASSSSTTTVVANAHNASISIDGSLTKLFQCMSLAYRQKLTSPKWNRFKGVRLRWKDKIRLNNVIWRCWHMQFILKQKTLVCQFASPLDVDQHNKPEAVVMEGKYWKRKLSTVAAEYKKWRLFYRNKIMGWTLKDPTPDLHPVSLDGFDWNRQVPFGSGPISNLIFDDDFLMDFSDTLFSSLSSNQLAFPNPRELARAGMVADFIQPGLVQLQPNLEDFMDTLEPLQDYVNSKLLPPVPEELDTLEPPDSLLPVEVLPSVGQKESSSMQSGNSSKVSTSNSSIRSSDPIQTSLRNSSAQNSVFYPMADLNQSVQTRGVERPQVPVRSVQVPVTPVPSSIQVPVQVPPPPPPATVVRTVPAPQTLATTSPAVTKTATATSSPSLLKESQYTPSSRVSKSSDSRSIFAVPKGTGPRGRNRRNASGRQALTAPAAAACPPQPSAMSHPAMLASSMSHPSSANSMANSNTLLSHLLTNTGQSGMDKLSQSQPTNLVVSGNQMTLGSSGSSSSIVPSGLHLGKDMSSLHSQSAQPWNPKNANETINSNAPINFGLSKPTLQNYSQSMGVGAISSGGTVSPPLLPNTPSPPHMGPPGGPGSPSKPFRPMSDTERVLDEHRRVCHINAEQKRRCNIKNGFDMLHSLIPQLSHNPNAKVSKAAMLQKGAEYIRQLKLERAQLKEEIEAHRQEVDALNSAINNCQSMLPATGAPVSRQRTNKMKEMFDQWVRHRTTDNWRFWIFSILIRPLLDSYNNTVSTASVDELCRTVLAWVDQHCSLVDLRPAVLNSLRYLCTTTEILKSPANLPEEAYKAVNRTDSSERDPR